MSPLFRVFTEAFLRRWHLSRDLCEVGEGEEERSRHRKQCEQGGRPCLSAIGESPTTQNVLSKALLGAGYEGCIGQRQIFKKPSK